MQPKYLARTALCIALLTSFSACGKREDAPTVAGRTANQVEAVAPPAAPATAKPLAEGGLMKQERADTRSAADRSAAAASSPAEIEAQLSSSAAASSFTEGERRFIRTAHAHFRAKDVYQSALAIEDAVAGQGGFVVKNDISSSVQRTQRRPSGDGKVIELAEFVVHGQLVVRVPSNKTQDFLRSIAGQIAFLDQRSFDARDAQFDLLRQQLDYRRNQETQEELGQANREGGKLVQKADVIASRSEAKAARDRARIAQKEFEDQIAFSTIRLSLYQLPNVRQTEVVDIDALFHQSRPSFGSRLGAALSAGWERTLDVCVQLVRVWPLWIVLALGGFALRRLMAFRRGKAKNAE